MANALILHSDVVSRAATTVSATNAVASMPASKLADLDVLDPFRSSTGATVISIDAGSSVASRGLFIAGLGPDALTGLTVFTVMASTVSQSGTDQLDWSAGDSGARYDVDRLYRQAWADFEATITARYWQVSLTAAGAAFLDIGRLFIGPDLGLSINIGHPFGDAGQDLALRERMANGRLAVYPQRLLRRYSLQVGDGITEADQYDLLQRTLLAGHGVARQAALIMDPAGDATRRRQAVLGRAEVGGGVYVSYGQLQRQIEIVEDGGIDVTRVIPATGGSDFGDDFGSDFGGA